MIVLQKSLTGALQSMESLNEKGFIFKTNSSCVWKWFPTLLSYCLDIEKEKNVCIVKHGLDLFMPCHLCITTVTCFNTMEKCDMTHSLHTSHSWRVVRTSPKEIGRFRKVGYVPLVGVKKEDNWRDVEEVFPCQIGAIFETKCLLDPAAIPYLYSIPNFEPLHNPSLVVGKQSMSLLVVTVVVLGGSRSGRESAWSLIVLSQYRSGNNSWRQRDGWCGRERGTVCFFFIFLNFFWAIFALRSSYVIEVVKRKNWKNEKSSNSGWWATWISHKK